MIYLVGGRGRLGQAIANEYADGQVVSLDRAVYGEWSIPNSSDKVSRYFADKASEATIFVVSGLLDPRLPPEDLLNVNFHLPKNIIEGVAKLGIKVITFGTVMEGLLKSKNPYIQTKSLLGDFVGERSSVNLPAIHLRIHTLYGLGEPSPFMFLGQILNSIRKDVPFHMTLGKQLREYHHITDEAKAIRRLAGAVPLGVMDISHGRPVSLKEIAESVFQSLGKGDLLQVGAIPEPKEENYERTFNRPDILKGMEFRDSLPAIVKYMGKCCLGSGPVQKNVGVSRGV